MTLSEDTLKSRVRNLTDYQDLVLDEADLEQLVGIAKDYIHTRTENYDLDWYDPEDKEANQALLWTTCLFVLLKAREIDGQEYALESLEIRPTESQGGGYGEEPLMWYANAEQAISGLPHNPDDDILYGAFRSTREERLYGEEQ